VIVPKRSDAGQRGSYDSGVPRSNFDGAAELEHKEPGYYLIMDFDMPNPSILGFKLFPPSRRKEVITQITLDLPKM
jgi:hypothetical protein